MKTGQKIQHYTVRKLIGRGAQGECWLISEGENIWLAKLYRLAGDEWEKYEIVEREAEILKQLEHPSIPQFRDMFLLPEENSICLVRQWVPGENLEQYIEHRRLSEKETRELALKLLEVLKYIHGLSPAVIHRDIKPSNVIVKPDGQVSLIDFGSVRDAIYAEEGVSIVGTYGYTPPEQFLGHPTPASDLYALGATLIFLLSRRHPSSLPIERNRLQFEPYINVQPRFLRILQKLLAPEVESRFQRAEEVIEALKRCESTTFPQAIAPTAPPQYQMPGKIEEENRTEEVEKSDGETVREEIAQWQRNREEPLPWEWEFQLDAEPNERTASPPEIIEVVKILREKHQVRELDEFSDPLELIEAIDKHFGAKDQTGRDYIVKYLHPFDAADILLGFYHHRFILPLYSKELARRFSLLFTHHSDSAVGQWVLLYFLHKHGWNPLENLEQQQPIEWLGDFPRWGNLARSVNRFFEKFKRLEVGRQAKSYSKLREIWNSLERQYRLCVSIRPVHVWLLVEKGYRYFEKKVLSSYPEEFIKEWQDDGNLSWVFRQLTLFPPNWSWLKKIAPVSNLKYHRLGKYAAALHLLYLNLGSLKLRLEKEYFWLLPSYAKRYLPPPLESKDKVRTDVK